MARGKKRTTSTKRDWRTIAFVTLNLMVVLSMALGYVLMIVVRR